MCCFKPSFKVCSLSRLFWPRFRGKKNGKGGGGNRQRPPLALSRPPGGTSGQMLSPERRGPPACPRRLPRNPAPPPRAATCGRGAGPALVPPLCRPPVPPLCRGRSCAVGGRGAAGARRGRAAAVGPPHAAGQGGRLRGEPRWSPTSPTTPWSPRAPSPSCEYRERPAPTGETSPPACIPGAAPPALPPNGFPPNLRVPGLRFPRSR